MHTHLEKDSYNALYILLAWRSLLLEFLENSLNFAILFQGPGKLPKNRSFTYKQTKNCKSI